MFDKFPKMCGLNEKGESGQTWKNMEHMLGNSSIKFLLFVKKFSDVEDLNVRL